MASPVLAFNSQLWWYTARAGGIVAWALLSASVLVGLFLSTKVLGKRPRPNWLLDFHRFLGGAAVIFTGVHLLSLVLDTYVTFGVLELFIPFTSGYRATAVAWGVVGFYLLIAIEITSLLRKKLSKRAWRAVHYASFPLFVLVEVHAWTAGTDGGTFLLRAALALAFLVVGLLTALRARRADDHDLLTAPRLPARPEARSVR